MDETSVSETPYLVRPWARRGRTPVVEHQFNWKRLSALVAVTHTGQVLRETIAGAHTRETFLAALQRMLEQVDGRVALLLDGAPIHRARVVTQWLESPEARGRIERHWLPAYAPDLNPMELGNSAAKRGLLGNFAAQGLDKLSERLHLAFDFSPETVTGFFRVALGTDFSKCPEVA